MYMLYSASHPHTSCTRQRSHLYKVSIIIEYLIGKFQFPINNMPLCVAEQYINARPGNRSNETQDVWDYISQTVSQTRSTWAREDSRHCEQISLGTDWLTDSPTTYPAGPFLPLQCDDCEIKYVHYYNTFGCNISCESKFTTSARTTETINFSYTIPDIDWIIMDLHLRLLLFLGNLLGVHQQLCQNIYRPLSRPERPHCGTL